MPGIRRRNLLDVIAVAAAAGLCLLPSLAGAEDEGPLVFAAASLKDALDAV